MNQNVNKVKIEINGARYSIATREDPEYVQKLAFEVDEQLKGLMENSPGMTLNDALVLTCLNFVDLYRKSEENADHIRRQLTEYIEDAARTRIALDDATRELERLKGQDGTR